MTAEEKTRKKGSRFSTRAPWVLGAVLIVGLGLSMWWTTHRNEGIRRQTAMEEKASKELPNRDFAFKVADVLNSNSNNSKGFGTEKGGEIHPASLINFSIRELEAMIAGIESPSWEDPYWRFSLRAIPSGDTVIGVWTKPIVFALGHKFDSKFFAITPELDCSKTTRTIHWGRWWVSPFSDDVWVLVRINRRGMVVTSEEELASRLDISVERVKTSNVWSKTCKWTVPTAQ